MISTPEFILGVVLFMVRVCDVDWSVFLLIMCVSYFLVYPWNYRIILHCSVIPEFSMEIRNLLTSVLLWCFCKKRELVFMVFEYYISLLRNLELPWRDSLPSPFSPNSRGDLPRWRERISYDHGKSPSWDYYPGILSLATKWGLCGRTGGEGSKLTLLLFLFS